MAEQIPKDNSTNQTAPKRFPTKENAQIQVYGQSALIQCRMANLSTTGALLKITNMKALPKQGDIIRLTVALRQVNKTHVVDAEVVWIKGAGVGVSFIKRDQIYEKLAHRASNL